MRALAEATLTLVLFTDASRIDVTALRREIGLPARLLGIGLPLTIVAGTAVAAGVFGGLSWAEALVLAIVLAPTDAALGQAVVTDPRLPVRIRQGLNVESGLNDGICVPLLFIALAIAEADEDAITVHHALRLVVEEIGWGVVGGAAAGVLAAGVLAVVERRRLVADEWMQVIPLAAAGARRTGSPRRSAAAGSSPHSSQGSSSAACSAPATATSPTWSTPAARC